MLTRRILIADSDPHMQAFAKRALVRHRFRVPRLRERISFVVESALTHDQAIRQLIVNPPDLVVMEHWAPGLDGLEILKALHELHSNTLAIVAATRPSIPAAVKATKLGAFQFLAKPVSQQQLCQTLIQATTQQLNHVVTPHGSHSSRLHDTFHAMTRIPAALAQLATTAVSLY